MLSKLHEAFPDFSWCSADRALFKAKMLFVWFVYLLFISLASGGHESPKRDYSVRRPHLGQLETWGGGRADLAHQWGSAVMPGKRKSRLKQNMGKEEG